MLIIRNILKAYAFNVLHFKCMTTFTIAMTMPDILINTANIFLNRGICELLSEIAKEEHIREPYSVVDYSTDILDPIDMLFTEMAAGEHFLCHPFFKSTLRTRLFLFSSPPTALCRLNGYHFVYAMPLLSA